MNYQERLLKAIPGGAHTYSRGFDQYPLNAPQILERGKGVSIFDPDGNKYLDYVMEKGYIGINGCSLTIGKVNKTNFYIHLIPETLDITNLDKLSEGDQVNIEIDQNTITVVNTVKKALAAQISS